MSLVGVVVVSGLIRLQGGGLAAAHPVDDGQDENRLPPSDNFNY